MRSELVMALAIENSEEAGNLRHEVRKKNWKITAILACVIFVIVIMIFIYVH